MIGDHQPRLAPVSVWVAAPLLVVAALVAVLVSARGAATGRGYQEPTRPTEYADGSYGFMMTQSALPEVPVGWDPCTRVPVFLNLALAPADAQRVVRQTIELIDRASGLQLYFAGTSTSRRLAWDADGHGILVSYDSPKSDPLLQGVGGRGGSSPSETPVVGRTSYYATGTATFNADENEAYRSVRLLEMEHELGHVVGLAHVDGNEVMNPTTSVWSLPGYQHGDLTGLARLGQLPCR